MITGYQEEEGGIQSWQEAFHPDREHRGSRRDHHQQVYYLRGGSVLWPVRWTQGRLGRRRQRCRPEEASRLLGPSLGELTERRCYFRRGNQGTSRHHHV